MAVEKPTSGGANVPIHPLVQKALKAGDPVPQPWVQLIGYLGRACRSRGREQPVLGPRQGFGSRRLRAGEQADGASVVSCGTDRRRVPGSGNQTWNTGQLRDPPDATHRMAVLRALWGARTNRGLCPESPAAFVPDATTSVLLHAVRMHAQHPLQADAWHGRPLH
jgi:hypothetical protein